MASFVEELLTLNGQRGQNSFILLAAKRALQIHKHLQNTKLTRQTTVDL